LEKDNKKENDSLQNWKGRKEREKKKELKKTTKQVTLVFKS
jgi:hypothetical protein